MPGACGESPTRHCGLRFFYAEHAEARKTCNLSRQVVGNAVRMDFADRIDDTSSLPYCRCHNATATTPVSGVQKSYHFISGWNDFFLRNFA